MWLEMLKYSGPYSTTGSVNGFSRVDFFFYLRLLQCGVFLGCAHHFNPQHWLLCHVGLHELESSGSSGVKWLKDTQVDVSVDVGVGVGLRELRYLRPLRFFLVICFTTKLNRSDRASVWLDMFKYFCRDCIAGEKLAQSERAPLPKGIIVVLRKKITSNNNPATAIS
jgi:hypothetical protein